MSEFGDEEQRQNEKEFREDLTNLINSKEPLTKTRNAVCTSWVIVIEWMDGEGEQWLSRMAAEDITTWRRDGMLHEVLYGNNWKNMDDE